MKEMISIIIPVYNTEKYIGECLESLINQTYENFEIIIIDDGSTDESLKICEYYKQKDRRIRICYQKNSGVSSARNKGLELANGQYIIFVDSDDYCNHNMLKVIIENLEEDSLVSYGFIKKYKKKQLAIIEKSFLLKNTTDIEEKILLDNKIGGYICNKVFSNELIQKYHLRFDTTIHYSEDLLFTLEYIKHIKVFKYISFTPYYYRMRKNSVSYNYITKKNTSVLMLYSKLIDYYSDNCKVINRLKYNYLVNYHLLNKINENKVRDDIVSKEKEIINQANLSVTELLKYNLIYKNISIYILIKKIKNLFEKVYE